MVSVRQNDLTVQIVQLIWQQSFQCTLFCGTWEEADLLLFSEIKVCGARGGTYLRSNWHEHRCVHITVPQWHTTNSGFGGGTFSNHFVRQRRRRHLSAYLRQTTNGQRHRFRCSVQTARSRLCSCFRCFDIDFVWQSFWCLSAPSIEAAGMTLESARPIRAKKLSTPMLINLRVFYFPLFTDRNQSIFHHFSFVKYRWRWLQG